MKKDFTIKEMPSEEKTNNLASLSKLVANKNQMTSVFTSKLIKLLGLSSKSNLTDLVNGIRKLKVQSRLLPQYIVKEIAEKIPTLRKQDGSTKELFVTYLLILLGLIEEESNVDSIKYLNSYVAETNIAAGYGKTYGRRWGFDFLTLEMSEERNRLSLINFGELKYRYNLETIMSRNQLPFSKKRRKKLENLENMSKIGPYLIFNGKLEYLPDTGFSYNSTPNRGNDLIVKMKSWNRHIQKIISNERSVNLNKEILLKKMSNGKIFHSALKEAILAQAYLEALCENGMIFTEKGEIKTDYVFYFTENNYRILIKSNDFKMCRTYSNEASEKHITFKLINKIGDKFPNLLNKNSDKYKIFVKENPVHDFEICKVTNRIIVSEYYYKFNKQKLFAEIKTRFVNEIRDSKLLSQWNGIVEKNTKIQSDLIFVTSSPKKNIDGEWEIWEALQRGDENNLVYGADRVYQFALKPQIYDTHTLKSKWFLELEDRLKGYTTNAKNRITQQKKNKQIERKGKDTFKRSYRELRQQWHKSGYPSINHKIEQNPENLYEEGINRKQSIISEWRKLRMAEKYQKNNETIRIKSTFVEPDSFESNCLDFHVVLLDKNSAGIKFLFEEHEKKPRVFYKVTIPKIYANLFPYPSKKVRNGKKNIYFRRGYMDRNMLDRTYQVLTNSKYLDKIDKKILEELNGKWISKLFERGKVEILFNSIEATILLLETLKTMKSLNKRFFRYLKSNKRVPNKFNTLTDFNETYSFGLIAESSKSHKKYVAYEILGAELLDFVKLIEARLGLMERYYTKYKWTRYISKLRKALKRTRQ